MTSSIEPETSPLTPDEQFEAQKRLGKAIRDYYDTVQPGVYVHGWVLGVHKMSAELQQHNTSSVGVTTPIEQSFVETRGIAENVRDLTI